MSEVVLGTLSRNVRPEELVAADVMADSVERTLVLRLSDGREIPLTGAGLAKLDTPSSVAWESDRHRDAAYAVISPPPAAREDAMKPPRRDPAGMPPSFPPDGYSPMLDPARPPEMSGIPDTHPSSQLPGIAMTYAVSVLAAVAVSFAAYAISGPADDIAGALASFGVGGFVVAAVAGVALGYVVDLLIRRGKETGGDAR